MSRDPSPAQEQIAKQQDGGNARLFDPIDTPSVTDSAAEEDDQEEYEIVEREILPAKIVCPDCGGITLEGLEFCDKCGGELQ